MRCFPAECLELMVQVAQSCVARRELLDAARAVKFLWDFGHIRAGVYEEAEEACDRRGQPLGVNKRFLSACLQWVQEWRLLQTRSQASGTPFFLLTVA